MHVHVCVCVCVCHRCDSIVPFSGLPNDDEEYFATSENDSDKVASKGVAAKSKSSKSTFSKLQKSQPLFKGTFKNWKLTHILVCSPVPVIWRLVLICDSK